MTIKVKSENVLRVKAMRLLINCLGEVDAERFINSIKTERFDYTEWQRGLWQDKTIDEIHQESLTLSIEKIRRLPMGMVYAEIILENTSDFLVSKRGFIKPDEVRKMTVNSLVDSGAYYLTINDEIRRQLGLDVIETDIVELADSTTMECKIAGPLTVYFKNRRTTCDALVLPNASEVLLGTIPLAGMDVIIDPKRQALDVNPLRPYIAGTKVK